MSLISVSEYALKFNKDPGNIRRMLACGRLAGQKIGKQWVVEESTPYPEDLRIKTGEYKNWRKRKIFTLEELSTIIKPIIKSYRASKAILFGSYARNEARLSSDIDLFVVGGKKFDPTDIFSIAEDIYTATGKNVDVYESKEISKESELYDAIKKEGIEIA